jgi:predicted dehydrogenase
VAELTIGGVAAQDAGVMVPPAAVRDRRVLIAGLGSMGRRHLRNLQALGVAQIVLHRLQPIPLESSPELPVVTDLGEALAARPDLVIVATPTSRHLDVAIPAAHAGCHLLIEKPLSHSWERVDELLRAVARRNLVAMVGFDLRFDPGLCFVKTLIDSGTIGRPVAIHAQVGQYLPDWHPAEDYRHGVSARRDTGGGVILDLIHELDYVRWLMGPVTGVASMAGHVSSLQIETEDVAGMLLQFESGAIGSVGLDYVQRSLSRTCRVIGEQGTILWDGVTARVRWYEAAARSWREYDYSGTTRNDRFVAEVDHLLRCLDGDAQPPVDVVAASDVLRLALAAKRAATDGVTRSLENPWTSR